MKGPERFELKLTIDRRALKVGLAVALLSVLTLTLSSETLKLTTTYPSPVGIYNYIITTGDAGSATQNTILARNAGNVGIGTAVPSAKLDVNGVVRVGSLPADPPGAEGMIYFNTARKTYRGFANGAWSDISGAMTPFFAGWPNYVYCADSSGSAWLRIEQIDPQYAYYRIGGGMLLFDANSRKLASIAQNFKGQAGCPVGTPIGSLTTR